MVYVTGSFESLKEISNTIDVMYKLQREMPYTCFISPCNAFSHLKSKQLPERVLIELRKDLLTCCEKLIVVGELDNYMLEEIELAKLCNMEVEYRL